MSGPLQVSKLLIAAFVFTVAATAPRVQAAIGDEVFGISFDRSDPFLLDIAGGQIITAVFGGVDYYGLDGLFIKRVSYPANEFFAFTEGIAQISATRFQGVGSLSGVPDTLSTWRVEAGAGGTESLVLESSVSLAAYAPVLQFNRAPDGSFWFLSNNEIVHLSAALNELQREPVPYPYQGIAFSSSVRRAEGLSVDIATGQLVLISSGRLLDMDGLPFDMSMAYYLDPTDLTVLGRFSLPDLPTGTTRDKFATNNNVFYHLNLSADTLIGHELSNASAPSLTSFQSDITGVLWRHCQRVHGFINFNDMPEATIQVDWGGQPGGIYFDAPTFSTDETFRIFPPPTQFSGTQFIVPYSLRDDRLFQQLPDITNPQSDIEIINSAGQSSGAITVQLDFTPSYAVGFGAGEGLDACPRYGFTRESTLGSGETGKWLLTQRAPPAPLDLSIDFAEGFPFIGGKTFGVQGFQFEAEAGMAGQGTDKITLSGGGTFKAGIGDIGIKASLGATTELLPETIAYDRGLVGFQIAGTLKAEQGVLELIPAFAVLAEVPFVGSVLKVATEAAKAVAEISLTADTTATVAFPQGDSVSDFCIEGKVEFTLGQKVGVVVDLLEGIAELSIFGGGANKISFQSVPTQCPSLAFNEWVAQIYLSARYVLFGATAAFEQVNSVKFPFPAGKSSASTQQHLVSETWHYTFPGNTRQKSAAPVPHLVNSDAIAESRNVLTRKGAGGISPTVQMNVINGVGQNAMPSAALAADGSAMLVWVQERGDLPPTQASDIYFSFSGGGGFTAPAPIELDTRADLNPVVAYHHSGRWVAVWLKVRDPNLQPTGDPQADALAQSRLTRPWFAVYNPATGTWSTPSEISSGASSTNASSYLPRIATGPQNEIAALWLTNPSGDLVAYDPIAQTTGGGDVVGFSIFDGVDFSIAGVLRQGSRVRFVATDLTGAFTGDELLIGFNEPFGSLFTPTFFVYRSIAPFSNFSNFEREPSSPGGGPGPKLMALNNGNFALGSVNNGRIVVTQGPAWNQLNQGRVLFQDDVDTNTNGGTGAATPGQFRNSYQMNQLPSGELYTVIPEIREGQPDYVLTLDEPGVTTTATAPVALEGLFNGGAIVEKHMSTASAPNGDVLMFYYQSDLLEDQVQLDLNDGLGEQTFDRVREPTTGRIMLARHQINTDLAVRDVSITVGLSEAGQEATVSAAVFNAGDRAVSNPTISLFARQISGASGKGPSTDIPIVENLVAVDGILPAGGKARVTLPWVLPENARYAVYAVVDPLNLVDEFNEVDNTGPDLSLLDVLFTDGFE